MAHHMKYHPSTRLLLLLTVSCAALSPGCATTHAPVPEYVGRAYPAAAPHAEILNVQVFRHPTQLEFTNTTARTFGPCSLWLNGRYKQELKGLAVGETVLLELKEFRDEFGEQFGAGGFWAADDPELLVLTQIEVADEAGKPQLLGLITIRAEE